MSPQLMPGVVNLVVTLTLLQVTKATPGLGCTDCVANAECGGDRRCVCKPGYSGDPHFYCRNDTADDCCCGNNDPVLMTLKNENVVYHLIGSSLLTELTTARRTPAQSSNHGYCYFRLYGWTERARGKFYFAGLGFEINQVHGIHNDSDTGFIYGQALSGQPYYNYSVNLNGNVDSGKEDDGCGVSFRHITRNFMKATAPCCGIDFAIRVHHPDFPGREPGYYFKVPKVIAHTFMTDEIAEATPTTGLCLGGVALTIEDIVQATGISDRRLALTYHAMTNCDDSYYPGAPPRLGQLKAEMKGCPRERREALFDIVEHFFKERMVRCMNGEGSSVDVTITVLLAAIHYVCHDLAASCDLMLDIISTSACLQVGRDIAEIGQLQNMSCI